MGSFDIHAKLKKTKWKDTVDEVSFWYSFVICLFETLPLLYFQSVCHKFDFFTVLVQFADLHSVSSGGNLSFWDNKRESEFMKDAVLLIVMKDTVLLNSSSSSSSYSRNSTDDELLQSLCVCKKRDGEIASSYECEKGYSVCDCRMKDTVLSSLEVLVQKYKC